MPRIAALVAVAWLVYAVPAAANDYASVARNIIPSGQYGAVPPPPQADEQARMYDALTPLFNQVTDADLLTKFKSERFGVDTAAYDDRSFVAKGNGNLPEVLDHESLKPEAIPADVAAFFKGFDAKRGDSLVAFGWAMAEDLAKLA